MATTGRGRPRRPDPTGPGSSPPDGWVAYAAGGWVAGQFAAAVAGTWLIGTLMVTGDALGVAAAAVLEDRRLTVTAGAPLLLVALRQVALWAPQLAAVALAAGARGSASWRALALRIAPRDVVWGIGAGVVAQIGIGVAYWLVRLDAGDPARQLVARGQGVAGLVALLTLLAVVGPFVEELLYRGLLLGGLTQRFGPGVALVVSSAIFALVHFQLVGLPGLFAAGMLFGWLRLRTGRLGPAIVAHMAFNATAVVSLALA